MTYAILFPGQGSQFVGMGEGLFEVVPDLLRDAADRVLDFDLAETCLRGPEEVLTSTERAQPALYAIAYAIWHLLEPHVSPPRAAAGHSLGEYTAHAAAGTFGFETGLELVAKRGRAMAEAAAMQETGMSAVLGIDAEGAEKAAADRRAEGGRLWVANVNSPGQVVLSGAIEDLEWVAANAGDYGGRRAIPLKVAGAFHSPFMDPARAKLDAALRGAAIGAPSFPVYANAVAAPAEDIRSSLSEQVVQPVLFQRSIEAMAADGIDTFVHVGPGDVTAGLVKRTLPDATTVVVSSPDDVAEAAAVIADEIH